MSIYFNNQPLEKVAKANLVGLKISDDLKRKSHFMGLKQKQPKDCVLLKQLEQANASAAVWLDSIAAVFNLSWNTHATFFTLVCRIIHLTLLKKYKEELSYGFPRFILRRSEPSQIKWKMWYIIEELIWEYY